MASIYRATHCLLVVGCLLASLASASVAAVVYVNLNSPGPIHDGKTWATAFQSLHDASAATSPGDEVWVSKGIYRELRGVSVKAGISIFGGFLGMEDNRNARNWSENVTIIDGSADANSVAPVVSIGGGSDLPTVFDGFTVQHGRNDYSDGGGVFCNASSPYIRNCIIRDNTAKIGGGVCIEEASPVLTNCVIESNAAQGNGGGIHVYYGSVNITDCIIRNNTASVGGGIGSPRNGSVSVYRSRIVSNYASVAGGGIDLSVGTLDLHQSIIAANVATSIGGGVRLDQVTAVMASNVFTANSAEDGGAICDGGYGPRFVNNTVIGNAATRGGGLFLDSFLFNSPGTIANSILAHNSSGVYVSSGSVAFSHNCFYGNGHADYEGITDPGDRATLKVEPQLASWIGGPHLCAGSPLIDAGDSAYVDTDWADVDGDPRRLGSEVDIGADEYVPVAKYSLPDAGRALELAAGVVEASPADIGRLDIVNDGSPEVDLADVIAIMRRVSGLEPNP